MSKTEFLNSLASKLSSLPQSEIEKTLSFYAESIDERVDEGIGEEEAVAALGDIDEIVNNVMLDMPIATLMKAKVSEGKENSSNRAVFITLLILSFPFVCVAAAVVFALYVAVWAVIAALFAVVFACGVSGVCAVAAGICSCFAGSVSLGICGIGAGLCVSSITLFLLKPSVALAKALIRFSASAFRKLKSLFITKKEAVK